MFYRLLVITAWLSVCVTAKAATNYDDVWKDTLLLDDGSLYIGQLSDSLFNGYGLCIYADGTVYEGYWKNGLWDGQGKVIYPDGDIYSGTFRNQIKEGKGTYFYNNGAKYDGEWKNDMFNGKGKLFFEDGGQYDGAWKDDMKHGYGKLISYNGRSYTGYFYYDEFLGMPFETEIKQDSILTDELKEWGFKQEAYQPQPTLSMALSYGLKGMATWTLWLDDPRNFFYGFTLGLNLDPPTLGVPSGLGWQIYYNDIHTTGHYVSSYGLVEGGYNFNKLSVGASIGLGLNTSYMNCRANGSPESYGSKSNVQYGDAYYRKSLDGHAFVYRGYFRYSIHIKKQPKALMYLGYGNADGLFIGFGLNLF